MYEPIDPDTLMEISTIATKLCIVLDWKNLKKLSDKLEFMVHDHEVSQDLEHQIRMQEMHAYETYDTPDTIAQQDIGIIQKGEL